MLILTRGRDERVAVTVPASDTPTRVEVIVASCRRPVRLGFDAPADVLVLRTEVEGEPPRDDDRGRAA